MKKIAKIRIFEKDLAVFHLMNHLRFSSNHDGFIVYAHEQYIIFFFRNAYIVHNNANIQNYNLNNRYDQAISVIRLHKNTDPIPRKKGVRQGDTLFPKLLQMHSLQDIFRKLD